MLKCVFEDGKQNSLRHVVTDNLVVNGNSILLVKRAERLLEGGKWALPGGYMERDETIKESVAREILEETGYEITDITLFRIIDRPDRPRDADRQNVAFVHLCTAGDKIQEPDDESSEQRWFSLGALPSEEEVAFDHYSDIQLYKKYLAQNFQLPVLGI